MDGGGGLYERDFYTWTRVQAEALRRIAEARPNLGAELDLPHLIEEVEDLGSEQLHAVQSQLQQLFRHLILLAVRPDDGAVNHWRGETVGFQAAAAARYLPSMRQNLAPRLDKEWRTAAKVVRIKLDERLPHLPAACPFTLDELLDEEAPLDPLLARLRPPASE